MLNVMIIYRADHYVDLRVFPNGPGTGIWPRVSFNRDSSSLRRFAHRRWVLRSIQRHLELRYS
jgi:hypothetical protein